MQSGTTLAYYLYSREKYSNGNIRCSCMHSVHGF